MKKNVVTLSDYNYLPKGLALYDSLIKTGSEFTLHYLCLDEKTLGKFSELNLENIIVYSAKDLASSDETLNQIRETDYWFFCMASASYFMNYLMNSGIEELTYVDSDIYFHQSINSLIEAFGDRQVAIFRHRQFPLDAPRPEGFYNVGVVHFKKGKFGSKILNWWSDAVLNRKFPELATCGDQKYLDRFPEMCPEDMIYLDGDVGHGAPWQWQMLDLSSLLIDGTIVFEGRRQKYFFSHFSQFSYDLSKNNYIPATMHHIYVSLDKYQSNADLKNLYDNYFSSVKEAITKYNLQ